MKKKDQNSKKKLSLQKLQMAKILGNTNSIKGGNTTSSISMEDATTVGGGDQTITATRNPLMLNIRL